MYSCLHVLMPSQKTGMDNVAVAEYLLARLPPHLFDGVVYLDAADRQMVLMRGALGRPRALATVGLPPERRFSFYDQVHTTGMDIKQAPSANAVLTIGKDMTFRDYAQGAYRMRQIGEGQSLVLYLIPEVESRMKEDLQGFMAADAAASTSSPTVAAYSSSIGSTTGMTSLPVAGMQPNASFAMNPLTAVPAWLLLNSMRLEALQFVMLSTQELRNVWRKAALKLLLAESRSASRVSDPTLRLRRFELADHAHDGSSSSSVPTAAAAAVAEPTLVPSLRSCVNLFREPLGVLHDLPPVVPKPALFADKVLCSCSEFGHYLCYFLCDLGQFLFVICVLISSSCVPLSLRSMSMCAFVN